MVEDQLENPAWGALTGSGQALGRRSGLAAKFDTEVSPFGAFAGRATRAHWDDMARLLGPADEVALIVSDRRSFVPPDEWEVLMDLSGVQMMAGPRQGRWSAPGAPVPDDTPVQLGPEEVDEMLELVSLTRPGPFLSRTVEFGGYQGIRRQGQLVAMAGERLHPPGYTEISAVATHPDHRRQGLAELLVRSVAEGILGRGETPMLHAAVDNVNAIRLYEAMGFTRSRTLSFVVLRSPLVDRSGWTRPVSHWSSGRRR